MLYWESMFRRLPYNKKIGFAILVAIPFLVFLTLKVSNFSFCKKNIIRAAFDVGSGSTKMKVYHYNECANSVEQIEDKECEAEEPVQYRKNLTNSNLIPQEILKQGETALKNLKDTAINCKATGFAGVATSVFRLANNGISAAHELSNLVKIPIKVVTQNEEARLGFRGAITKEGISKKQKVCVWDIGASSVQITCSNGRSGTKVYQGKLASIGFMEQILELQNRTSSPNPISLSIYNEAFEIAKDEAQNVRTHMEDLLKNSIILGIGGVHYYAVSKELELEEYNQEQIKSGILRRLDKTDDELGGGKFVNTAVSNLILVEGMMAGMEINSVKALKVNLTEGLAVSDNYWEN